MAPNLTQILVKLLGAGPVPEIDIPGSLWHG
jgi:hypothetical protein